MVQYPISKQWADYPHFHIPQGFPFHIKLATLNRHFPIHRHDFLELSFIIEGEGYQVIDDQTYPMQPGTFMFLLPFQIQEMITVSPLNIRLYNCMFDLRFLSLPTGAGSGLDKLMSIKEGLPSSIHVTGEEQRKVTTLFQDMQTEFSGNDVWRNQSIQVKLWELLIRFDRLRRLESGARPLPDGDNNIPTIWSIIRYIHLHYYEPLTLTDLAHKFGWNHSQLSREFKKHVGVNYIHFLHEIHIRSACSLLASTDMSMVEIAIEVGFGSCQTFSRIFRELKGIIPSEYKKQFLHTKSRYERSGR